MFRWFNKKLNNIFEPYDMSCNYKIMISDEITGQEFSIVDWIKALDERIQSLEDSKICMRKNINDLTERCKNLEDENVSLNNSLYEIANSLEARIDILASEPYKLPSNIEKLQ
jgi:hypothetical protein